MHSFKAATGVILLAAAAMVASLGCERDEFDEAPTVEAPERSEARGDQQAGASPGAVEGNEDLPADHPPIDQPSEATQGAGQPDPEDQLAQQPDPSGESPDNGAAGGAPPMQQGGAPQQGQGGEPAAGGQADSVAMQPDEYGEVGPLRWEAPDEWQAVQPSSQMRLAEYRLEGEGDRTGELTVFYFGRDGGGSIQANIDRWVGQFDDQSGEPEQREKEVNGLAVHLVEAAGDFNPGVGMGGGGDVKEDWRLKGAIAESPAGNFFFKLTGPAEVVESHESEFDAFVSSFEAG